ncbi:MAG: hypothetical protein JHC26_11755 [Thermofilum sp.]|jgi:hypothetical protein|uniref:hypothetical protein n=1 Tax=Thermofilum sp. TaxID=1961369 RepID=UPI002582AE32|nr:hypothetical protein [Thermofilum sp.]MCI4409758.1 hypothetical protein [Thermofilum sp.]
MGKQELEDRFTLITEADKLVSRLKERLEPVFPKIHVENNKLVAELDGPEVVLAGWLLTRDYYVIITYEKQGIVIEAIVDGFVYPTREVQFIARFTSSIKDLILEYNAGREMDHVTAEQWINHFEPGLTAMEKDEKLKVMLRPRFKEDDPNTFIDVYEVSGRIDIEDLTIRFRGLECFKAEKFLVTGELTTKRFKNILKMIRSFEMYYSTNLG